MPEHLPGTILWAFALEVVLAGAVLIETIIARGHFDQDHCVRDLFVPNPETSGI